MPNVQVQISEETIANLLCCAWEGWSNYWATAEGQPYSADDNPLRLRLDLLDAVIEHGDDEEPKRHTLDQAAIDRGVAALASSENSRLLADIVRDDYDADSGDWFLQLCLFGKLIYG